MDAAIAFLLVAALAINLPLGAWRYGLRRFSPWWFVAVHASIPVLLVIRLTLVPVTWVIPPEIGLALVGQMVGGRLPRMRASVPEGEGEPAGVALDGG